MFTHMIDGSGILGTLATIEYRLPSKNANQLYSLIFFFFLYVLTGMEFGDMSIDGGGILGHEY